MSWSVAFVGRPEAVVKALLAHSESLNGYSLAEYEAARPLLVGLVQENFVTDGGEVGMISLTASGSGQVTAPLDRRQAPRPLRRALSVRLEPFYGNLVT